MEFIKHTNKPQTFLNLSNSETHFCEAVTAPLLEVCRQKPGPRVSDEVPESGQRLEFLQAAVTC